jgi:putative transposase
VTVGRWKKEIQDQAKKLFESSRGSKAIAAYSEPERLFSEIGRLKMELDWLKKVRDQPVIIRQSWVSKEDGVSLFRQRELAGVCRSTIYRRQITGKIGESNLLFHHLLDEKYTRHSFYGSRRMLVFLKRVGYNVNRKRVHGLMWEMGLAGAWPQHQPSAS